MPGVKGPRGSYPTTNEEYLIFLNARSVPEPFSGCWLWVNSVDHDGYGKFSLRGKCIKASKAAWLLNYGDIPSGLCVCHECDVRCCINPRHLFLGTQRDNTMDKIRKGRQPRGERAWAFGKKLNPGEESPKAKLTNAQAIEIRQLKSSGMSNGEIGKKYGVRRELIWGITSGRTYLCE